MKFILSLITIIIAFSCSPEKRMARLIKHHPELVNDTVVSVYDTIKIPGFRTDTMIRYTGRTDTIVITKNNVTTKFVVHKDSIFVNQAAQPIQQPRIIRVPVVRVISQNNDNQWLFFWVGISIAFAVIIIAAIVLKYLK